MIPGLEALAPLLGGVGQIDDGTKQYLNALKLQTLTACIGKQLATKSNPNMMFMNNDIDRVGTSIAGNQSPIDLMTILQVLPLLQGLSGQQTTAVQVEEQDDKLYQGVLARIKKEYTLTPRKPK